MVLNTNNFSTGSEQSFNIIQFLKTINCLTDYIIACLLCKFVFYLLCRILFCFLLNSQKMYTNIQRLNNHCNRNFNPDIKKYATIKFV